MNKLDRSFLFFDNNLSWLYALKAKEKLEGLLKNVRTAYEQKKLSVDHFIALLNRGQLLLDILKKEENEDEDDISGNDQR